MSNNAEKYDTIKRVFQGKEIGTEMFFILLPFYFELKERFFKTWLKKEQLLAGNMKFCS